MPSTLSSNIIDKENDKFCLYGTTEVVNTAIYDASGNQITSFGGGTQYCETSATCTNFTGTMMLVEGASDCAKTLKADASGNLCITGGGGTQYAEDAALGATPTGTLAMARRCDTLGTLTPVLNDAVSLRTSDRGALWVCHDGAVTANAGTGNFCVVQAAAGSLNATVAGTVDIGNSPTVTANAGTGVFDVTPATPAFGDYLPVRLTNASTFDPALTVSVCNAPNIGSITTLPPLVAGTACIGTVGQGSTPWCISQTNPASLCSTVTGTITAVTSITNPVTISCLAIKDYNTDVACDCIATIGIVVPSTTGSVAITGDATNGLDVDVTRVPGFYAQNSATSGQCGGLIQGAVTTIAPSYSTLCTQPLSLTTSGGLRVQAQANSGVDIGDVDILSVIPGTGATNLGKAEDDGHASGHTGVFILGVRNDGTTQTTLTTASCDYSPIATDLAGNLLAVGNLPSATTDAGNPVKIGGLYTTTPPTLTTGQRGNMLIDVNGRLCTTSGGLYCDACAGTPTCFMLIGGYTGTCFQVFTTDGSGRLSSAPVQQSASLLCVTATQGTVGSLPWLMTDVVCMQGPTALSNITACYAATATQCSQCICTANARCILIMFKLQSTSLPTDIVLLPEYLAGTCWFPACHGHQQDIRYEDTAFATAKTVATAFPVEGDCIRINVCATGTNATCFFCITCAFYVLKN